MVLPKQALGLTEKVSRASGLGKLNIFEIITKLLEGNVAQTHGRHTGEPGEAANKKNNHKYAI